MPTGHYQRKPRVERVVLHCEVCNAEITLLPSVHRRRKTVRFCSRKCMGIASRKASAWTETTCSRCGKAFSKRTDHVTERNYCSLECTHAARRKTDAKWRNPAYIREYHRRYVKANSETLNKQAREHAKKHPERKKKTAAKYRATHKAKIASHRALRRGAHENGEFTEEQWESMKEKYNHTCLRCGKREPDIKLTIDHVIPLVRGGEHSEANIQPLCKSCNSSKNAKHIDYREQYVWRITGG